MPLLNQIKNAMSSLNGVIPQYCDKCGTKHTDSDLEIVANDTHKAVCRLGCANCGNSYMIHVNMPMNGVFAAKRMAYNTDMNAREMKKFSNTSKIDQNEIIDVFTSLKDIKNIQDFNDLSK